MDPIEQKFESVLLLPQVIVKHIHRGTGYIAKTSVYYGKSTYGLFISPANIDYITRVILHELKGKNIKNVGVTIQRMMRNYKRIKTGEIDRETANYNPVIELAYRNREFVLETLKNIQLRNMPHRADHKHHNYLMSYQNIDDTDFKEVNWGTRYKHLGDTQRNVYRWKNRIPPDRISAQQRHHERDNREGLRDIRELETQIHGYDMSGLVANNTNNVFDNNEYTAY